MKINWLISLVGRVFTNGPNDHMIPKFFKWYLIHPYLTLGNIRYISREMWRIAGKEYNPPLHLSVVAVEKGAFWSPSTTVTSFTFYLYIYIYIYICYNK